MANWIITQRWGWFRSTQLLHWPHGGDQATTTWPCPLQVGHLVADGRDDAQARGRGRTAPWGSLPSMAWRSAADAGGLDLDRDVGRGRGGIGLDPVDDLEGLVTGVSQHGSAHGIPWDRGATVRSIDPDPSRTCSRPVLAPPDLARPSLDVERNSGWWVESRSTFGRGGPSRTRTRFSSGPTLRRLWETSILATRRSRPDHLALVGPDGTERTAGELLAAANRAANGFALGLEAGDTAWCVAAQPRSSLPSSASALQVGLYFTPVELAPGRPRGGVHPRRQRRQGTVVHEFLAEVAVNAVAEAGFRPTAASPSGRSTASPSPS